MAEPIDPDEGGVPPAVRGARFEMSMDGDGILHCVWDADAVIDATDAREAMAAVAVLAGETARPLLADMRRVRVLERGAREAFAEEAALSRQALLTDTALSRTLANVWIRLSRDRAAFPTRMFTDETAARAWLTHDG